jgi:hypothetical protein
MRITKDITDDTFYEFEFEMYLVRRIWLVTPEGREDVTFELSQREFDRLQEWALDARAETIAERKGQDE